jgi:hypothetical protein
MRTQPEMKIQIRSDIPEQLLTIKKTERVFVRAIQPEQKQEHRKTAIRANELLNAAPM